MDETAARVRATLQVTPLVRTLSVRILKEIGLGLIALGTALVVIVPVLFLVSLLYNRSGVYAVLAATVLTGVGLLFYQARLRARLIRPAYGRGSVRLPRPPGEAKS